MNRYHLILMLNILFLAACFSPSKVTYKQIENLKVKKVGLSNIILSANAVLMNDNSSGVTINGIDSEIFIDGEKVADMTQNVNTKMPANSEFKLPLEFKVPTEKVIENAGGLLGSVMNTQKMKVLVKGTIKVNVLGTGIPIPFSQEEEIKLR